MESRKCYFEERLKWRQTSRRHRRVVGFDYRGWNGAGEGRLLPSSRVISVGQYKVVGDVHVVVRIENGWRSVEEHILMGR
jgi:hypothetical protein